MKNKNKVLRVLAMFILSILIYIMYTAVCILAYSDNDEMVKTDVIIVLGAAAYDSGVSPVYRERLNHSIELYKEGYSDKIIVTGGYAKGNQYSDAYIAMQYLIECGIPENDIILEEKSVFTSENIDNSKTIMDEKGYINALIVSDPIHMKRSMYLANKAGIKAYASPTKTSMYRSWRKKLEFLCSETVYYIGYQITDLLNITL